MMPSSSSQYRGDTQEALAASLHLEFSISSDVNELAVRYRQLITTYLDHVTGTETSSSRRALHVGCATGRLTFELATLFREASHNNNNNYYYYYYYYLCCCSCSLC